MRPGRFGSNPAISSRKHPCSTRLRRSPRARSVFATTRTIPIVVVAGHLLENGLVESLARLGGNLTGTTHLGGGLDGKRLELLQELIPATTRVAVTGAARTSIARMAAAGPRASGLPSFAWTRF